MSQPITFRWNGEVMTPRQKWQASRQFESGHEYTLVEHEERSSASHAHFFATVNEAWKTLPEHLAKRFPDAAHLRKWLLTKRGFSIDRTIVAETDEGAREIAALAGQLDPSAVIVTQGNIVTVSVARSQKSGHNGMNKEDFQRSKSAVLEELAIMLGVDVPTLSSQVPNSSGPSNVANGTAADAPGDAISRPQPQNGSPGATIQEASTLSPDWQDVYITSMSGVRDKAASLKTRNHEAWQMIGGVPNETEKQWMREIWNLVHRRDTGQLKLEDFEKEIQKLKQVWASAEAA